MIEIKYNINHHVKVKITKYGYEKWLEYLNQFSDEFPGTFKRTTLEELKTKEDNDGWVKFQMWDMMSIFGQYMQVGFKNPIDTNIIILKNLST